MSRFADDASAAAREWRGPTRPYDLLKEFAIALVVITILSVVLAALFSSPDEKPVTIASWARADPVNFVATAATELDGTSGTATYGPPYNHTPDAAQRIGPVSLQQLAGARIQVNTAQDFVLGPLGTEAGDDPALGQALDGYRAAGPNQRLAWTSAYEQGAADARASGGTVTLPAGDYGPVGTMMDSLLAMARSGALDGALLASKQFYQTDYTKPLLFIADGSYFEAQAEELHLTGEQWGMMNETGSYPGQTWLWLYTFWYQVPPFRDSGNADALIWAIMAVLTLAFVCVPFIPGLRSLPRRLGVYKLIWRDYYRSIRT